MGKTKKYTLLKAIFRYSLRNFVKLFIYISNFMLIGKAKEEICSFFRSKSKRFGQKHLFPTSLVKHKILREKQASILIMQQMRILRIRIIRCNFI